MCTIDIMNKLSEVLDEYGIEHGPVNIGRYEEETVYSIEALDCDAYMKVYEGSDIISVHTNEGDAAYFSSVRAAVDWLAESCGVLLI